MYISITVVALVLGLMLAFQFRTNRSIEQGIPIGRAQEMNNELRQLEKDREKMQNEIADLNNKLSQVNNGQTQALQAIQDELKKARLNAGVVAMKGPGIEVTLDNPPQSKKNGEGAGLFIVRDEDLLRVVNELRGAGAEAISINGQRVIATSEIRLAGSFININLNRIVPPYRIMAIGKSDNLRSALEISGGLAEYLRDLGIQIKIQAHDSLIVPAFTGKLDFHYAKPTQKG